MKSLFLKFRAFFKIIWRSCYDMEWYRVVRTRPLAKALAYLAGFSATVAFIAIMILTPGFYFGLNDLRSLVGSRLPAGATFSLKNGGFSTNLAQPFSLGEERAAIVIDTGIAGRDLPETSVEGADIVIGRDALFFRDSASAWQTLPLASVPDFSTTKEKIADRLEKYGFGAVALFSALLGAGYFAMLFVGSLFYAVLASLLTSAVSRLSGPRLRFSQWLSFSLHAITLPTIVTIILSALKIRLPFAFSVIFLLFVIALAADERSRPTSPPADTAESSV